ncbi:MAG: hypothetical protein H6697_05280 [Myxococcales bacterium]|nr:hypothetical protein [Myxococcales bacterium]MCB9519352.1 hypothetical protein [Myxococcales bacterium]
MSSTATDRLRAEALADPDLPRAVRRALESGLTLEPITLRADGTWMYRGGAVENARVAELFSRSLGRTAAGTWLLHVAPYTYPATVEGAGWFVRALSSDLARGTTTGGEAVAIDWSALATDGDTLVGVGVGGGRLARLVGPAFATFAEALDGDDSGWSVIVGGVRWYAAPAVAGLASPGPCGALPSASDPT